MRRAPACAALLLLGAGLTVSFTARAADDETMASPRWPPKSARPGRSITPAAPSDHTFERDFPFCRDEHHRFTAEDLAWCAAFPEPRDLARCPSLARACRGGAVTAENAARGNDLRFPTIGPVLQVLAWVAVGLAVVWLVLRLIKLAPWRGERREDEPTDEDSEDRSSPALEARAADVERDVTRLLQRARAAAAAGRFRDGVTDAWAALLRKLEAAAVVRVEADRTNGDHLRDFAGQFPAERPRLAALIASVEEAQFGGTPPDERAFRAVLDSVVTLLRERPSALVLPFALFAALATATFGCTPRPEAHDQGPSGHAAVESLLRAAGFDVRERLLSLGELGPFRPKTKGKTGKTQGKTRLFDQLIVLSEARIEEADWDAMQAWVVGGGTLVVAGARPEMPAWVGIERDDGATLVDPVRPAVRALERLGKPVAVVPPGPALKTLATGQETAGAPAAAEPPKTKADDDDDDEAEQEDGGDTAIATFRGRATPLLMRGARLYAMDRNVGRGRVVVLADDRLFTNAAMLVEDDARLVVSLIDEGGPKVEIAGELTGLVSPNPFTSVRRGRLMPVLLQLAALAILLFVCKGAAFGTPIDPAVARRRAFSEHVRALGRQYERAGASRHALEAYATYATERLRERLRLSGRALHDVAEAVAARGPWRMQEILSALVDARPETTAHLRPAAKSSVDLAALRLIARFLAAAGGSGRSDTPPANESRRSR